MLRQRALSAAVLVPPLLVAIVLGDPWIPAVVALATGLAALETFSLLRAAGFPTLRILGTILAVAVVVEAAVPRELDGSGQLLIALGAILIAVAAFALDDPRDGLVTWLATVFGAVYASLLAFVVRLGEVAPAIPVGAPLAALDDGRGWILVLVVGVWGYDTGAYLVGRRFGRRRFLAHISPSKTYAGLLGGLVAAGVAIGAVLAGLGQPPIQALLLGPLVGLASQAGDLAESMLKRAAGAKDSGSLIPGHGGILDRLDSFLFAAPVVTLYVVTLVR
ncbi:MAG TPA: phosphatidate cytidylyltransferase [Candidatus Limnocylindrales bacterium]|jgi:phosphatidate cytidylyltransferase